MNRMVPPSPPPHFDLLHCARRVLKRRLSSVRLVILEQEILGCPRIDDVDGGEIPYIYFDYLNTGQPGLLPQVIRHNELDLLAMPAILGWLGRQYRGLDRSGEPADWVGLAQLASRNEDMGKAKMFATAAIDQAERPDMAAEASLLLAQASRRLGDLKSEIEHLERVIQLDVDAFLARAHHRLAIAFEHDVKDFGRALAHARKATAHEGYFASEKRQRRLQIRLDRSV